MRAKNIAKLIARHVKRLEGGRPTSRRHVGGHLHAIQLEQIAALEECFAKRTVTGWEIPEWLEYLASVSPMRMPVNPMRDVTGVD